MGETPTRDVAAVGRAGAWTGTVLYAEATSASTAKTIAAIERIAEVIFRFR